MVRKSGLQIFSTDFRCGKNSTLNLLFMTGKRIEFYLKSGINDEAKNTIQSADPHCHKYLIPSSNAPVLSTCSLRVMGNQGGKGEG